MQQSLHGRTTKSTKEVLPGVHGFRWDIDRKEAVGVYVNTAFLVELPRQFSCEENVTKPTSCISPAGVKCSRTSNPGFTIIRELPFLVAVSSILGSSI